jgi:hypothetical protein
MSSADCEEVGGSVKRFARIIPSVISILYICALSQRVSSQTPAQTKRIVIAASQVLDGTDHVLPGTRIVVEGRR